MTECARCHAPDPDAWLCARCRDVIAVTAAATALLEAGLAAPVTLWTQLAAAGGAR